MTGYVGACRFPGCTADLTGATLAERRAHSRERHPMPSFRVPPVPATPEQYAERQRQRDAARRERMNDAMRAAARAASAARKPTKPEPVPARRPWVEPGQPVWPEPNRDPEPGPGLLVFILEIGLVVLFVAAAIVSLMRVGL
jgi:hypothetical protein